MDSSGALGLIGIQGSRESSLAQTNPHTVKTEIDYEKLAAEKTERMLLYGSQNYSGNHATKLDITTAPNSEAKMLLWSKPVGSVETSCNPRKTKA